MKINFDVDKNEVLRYSGQKDGKATPQIEKLAESYAEKIKENISPRHIAARFNLSQMEDGVMLSNGILLKGNDIKKHLSDCDECYIICATVGIQADSFIRSSLAMGSVYGLMADAAATAAVESYCDNVENELRQQLKKEKLYLTWRYSPGYGDFPFTQQPEILSILKADRLVGVTCNDSCIMTPSKSVTAVMGIAKNKPAARDRACDTCPNKDNCNFSCRQR